MGYLNKATVTVDAILTKKGRELLSKGSGYFSVSKFAVADDEIDYTLYDPAHPLGTEYYGSAIENMPIVEASPDETQNMRYKLVTLSRNNLNYMPVLINVPTTVDLQYLRPENGTDGGFDIRPTTSNDVTGDSTAGYTAILYNGDAVQLISDQNDATVTGTLPSYIGDISTTSALTSVVKKGKKFTLVAKNVSAYTQTQIVLIGNSSGATKTVTISINPASS